MYLLYPSVAQSFAHIPIHKGLEGEKRVNIELVLFFLFSVSIFLAEAIYINSAHQRVIGMLNVTKDCLLWSATVLQMTRSTRVRIRFLADFLFKFHIASEKHLFSIMKEIIKKLKKWGIT